MFVLLIWLIETFQFYKICTNTLQKKWTFAVQIWLLETFHKMCVEPKLWKGSPRLFLIYWNISFPEICIEPKRWESTEKGLEKNLTSSRKSDWLKHFTSFPTKYKIFGNAQIWLCSNWKDEFSKLSHSYNSTSRTDLNFPTIHLKRFSKKVLKSTRSLNSISTFSFCTVAKVV